MLIKSISILLGIAALLAFLGIFNRKHTIVIPNVFPLSNAELCLMKIYAKSKSTFMVKNNIHFDIKLFKPYDVFKDKKIQVFLVYPGTDAITGDKENEVNTPSIDLKYNKSEECYTGNGGPFKFFVAGDYDIRISIDNEIYPFPLKQKLHIAPHEVLLQIKNNNLMTSLALLGLLISLLQIF